MTLRTRFVLLIVGSVVVPPLMLIVATITSLSIWAAPDEIHSYLKLQRLLRTGMEGTVQTVEAELDELSGELSIVLLGGDGRIVYPASRSGEAVELPALGEHLVETGDRHSTIAPLTDERGGTGLIIAPYSPRPFPSRFSAIGLVLPLAFVLFSGIASAYVIRSINSSIATLEAATRRIAEGDLDFELTTSGRDRIASLTRSFDAMRHRLKEEYDRSSRFLMAISHDLKTPLSSISGYIDAIRDGYADSAEKLDKYTSIVQTKTRLLESRILALIDYAKQETRDWKADLQPIGLAAFIEEFASLAEADAHARGFGFAIDVLIDHELTVAMDPDMINRAMENIVANAFTHATPGSTVRLLATSRIPAGDWVDVVIENEGKGIAADDLSRVFDPLFRATGDRPGTGFGLGLSIVKSVITSHGWSVTVDSTPEEITRFTIRIPLAPETSP